MAIPTTSLNGPKVSKPRQWYAPQLPAMLLFRDLTDAFQEAADRSTVCIDIEHILILRKMDIGKGQKLFGNAAEVDAGSETDTIK